MPDIYTRRCHALSREIFENAAVGVSIDAIIREIIPNIFITFNALYIGQYKGYEDVGTSYKFFRGCRVKYYESKEKQMIDDYTVVGDGLCNIVLIY